MPWTLPCTMLPLSHPHVEAATITMLTSLNDGRLKAITIIITSITKWPREPSFQVLNNISPSCATCHSFFTVFKIVSPLKGRFSDIVEMPEWRFVDVCCIQEIRGRGASARVLRGEVHRYKCSGKVIVMEWESEHTSCREMVDKVIEAVRLCSWVLKLRLFLQNRIAKLSLPIPFKQAYKRNRRITFMIFFCRLL